MGSMASAFARRVGLGTVAPITSEINQGVTVAGAGVAAAASAGALTAIGISAAAVPFIGPIVAGITLAISALGIGQGCGATCTQATDIVNQAAPLLQQNLDAATQTVQQSGCLTTDEVQVLENNFNQVFNAAMQGCAQIPAPGGTQCVADRQPGGKYDWTSYYLTPIKNMPVCQGSDASVSGSIVGSSSGFSGTTLLLIALGAAALMMGSE